MTVRSLDGRTMMVDRRMDGCMHGGTEEHVQG
jgi:hypothetical protein